MNVTLISIGTELITGQIVDTNTTWLSAKLAEAGALVVRHITVADSLERTSIAIAEGLAQTDLVITTGGLGPTVDDLTRQAISEAVGQPLELREEALEHLRGFFRRWDRPMPDDNRLQAMFPKGCGVVPNHRGTAPGIHYQGPQSELFALPGVPSEMEEMFRDTVLPSVSRGTGEVCLLARQVLCYGLSEAKLGEVIADLMVESRNPSVGTTAKDAVIGVRLLARGKNRSEALELLDSDIALITERLGSAVFGLGDETLQLAVARLLWEKGKTVATAESCTGGLIAKRLTDIPDSSRYFLHGFVTYSNQAKTRWLGVSSDLLESNGAVSEPVARAMATGCLEASGADYAMAVTGIAGPGGGSPPERPVGLVYIALASRADVHVKRILAGQHLSRTQIRDRTAKTALNMLRLRLLEQ